MKRYFQAETIDNYKCLYCKQVSTIFKQQHLLHCPDILLVYIKRFNMYEAVPRKLDTKIKASDFLFLELAPIATDTGAFDLNSFVRHKGQINSGHYVATIRKNDNWIMISDEKGGIDNMQEIATNGSSEIYLMAYVKNRK